MVVSLPLFRTKKHRKVVRSGYAVVGGSRKGASHWLNGTVNQDASKKPRNAYGLTRVAGANGDGHSEEDCFRSSEGSNAAVHAGYDAMNWLLEMGNDKDKVMSAVIDELLTTRLPQTIYRDWRRRVEADFKENPFSAIELCELSDSKELALHRDPKIAYGTTLMACGLCESWGAVASIGDGSIAVINPNGDLYRPFSEDHETAGDATDSLCSPDAVDRIRTAHIDFSNGAPRAVLMCTDGYAKSFGSVSDIDQGFLNIYQHAVDHGVESLEKGFTRMLDETSAAGSGDDISMLVFINLEYLTS